MGRLAAGGLLLALLFSLLAGAVPAAAQACRKRTGQCSSNRDCCKGLICQTRFPRPQQRCFPSPGRLNDRCSVARGECASQGLPVRVLFSA
jgi:hypothetical protein